MTSSTIQDAINETDTQFNDDPQEVLRNNLNSQINNQGVRNVAGATYEITSGLAFDAATAPLGLAPPLYAALNFGEGSINNIVAQKIRGRKWNEIDWNEVISSGVLGIVPLSQLRAAKYLKKPVAETVEKVVGKQDTLQRYIASGAITGGGDVTIRSGLAGEAPSPENLAAGTVGGAVIGGTLSPLLKQLSKTVTGIVQQKRVSKAEAALLSKQLEMQERTQGDFSKLTQEDGAELRRLLWNVGKEKGEYKGFASYETYLVRTRHIQGNLQNNIDGEDSFWAPLKRLKESANPKDQEKYTEINEFLEGKVSKKGERYGGYFKQEEANEILKARAEEAFAAGRKVEGYRRVAGFLPLKDRTYPSGKVELGLESIARKHGYTIEDVHKYIVDQEEGNKYLHAMISELNERNRNKQVNILEELYNLKERMGKAGFRTTQPWFKIYKDLLKKAKLDKYQFGHKESLWMHWVNELSGGNRVTNTYVQSRGNWSYVDFYGKRHIVKGNTSLGARDDDPIFTLVKLQGASENLEDDFRKYMMPMASTSSIPEEYEDLGRVFYRNLMAEVKLDLDGGLSSEEYHAELGRHSIAITQALHVMFRKADDLNIPEMVLDDDVRLKIPAKVIYEGLDSQTQKELLSAKNLAKKLKIVKDIFLDTLDTLLEEL